LAQACAIAHALEYIENCVLSCSRSFSLATPKGRMVGSANAAAQSAAAAAATAAVADGAHCNGLIGRQSRRRENSAARLHGVMSRVSVDINNVMVEPVPANAAASGGALPTTPGRKKSVSLRFPRAAPGTSQHGGGMPRESSSAGSIGFVDGKYGEQAMASVGPASAIGMPASSADELEDLRLQNAVLRKSLTSLQQSVVESMKGNKGQFVGNGKFTKRAGDVSAIAQAPARKQAADAEEADLEGLRVALSERRAALRVALEERDSALQDAAGANRELEELRRRAAALQEQLAGSQEQCASTKQAKELAELECQAMAKRASKMQARVHELGSELDDARGEVDVARLAADDLRRQLEEAVRGRSAAEAECAGLHAVKQQLEEELRRLRSAAEGDSDRLSRLASDRRERAGKLLSYQFGGTLWLRACVGAWHAWCSMQREDRLQQRAETLEAGAAKLSENLGISDSARQAADVLADTKSKEAQDAEERLRESERLLWEARAESSARQVDLLQAQDRADALNEELQNLMLQQSQKVETRSPTAAENAAEQLRCLQEEMSNALQAAQQAKTERDNAVAARDTAAKHAAADRAKREKDAAAKEDALRKELEKATQAAKQAKELASVSVKAQQEAQKKAVELETQLSQAQSSIDQLEKDVAQKANEASESQQKAQAAEKQVRELQKNAEALQKRLKELEAKEAELEAKKGQAAAQSDEAVKGWKEEAARAIGKADGLAKENGSLTSQLSEVKLSLAVAKSDAGAATQKVNVLKDEKAALKTALSEAKAAQTEAEKRMAATAGDSKRFAQEARQALEEARKGIRLMVTAPKVSVNVGGNNTDLHVPFPFAAIKDSVQKELMPKFAKIQALSEQAGDAEIKKDVQAMVEQLALTLQSKVHELMPQAEGTCNWDGFGAKAGTLSGK